MISKQFCQSRINSNCKTSKETDFFLLFNRNTKKQLIFTDYEKEKKIFGSLLAGSINVA